MNERIEELIEECTKWWADKGHSYFDKEKFAELIIRECIGIIEHGMDHTDYDDPEKSMVELKAQRWCRDTIKEEFGVE